MLMETNQRREWGRPQLLLAGALAVCFAAAAVADDDPVQKAFAALDGDGNGRLTADEYIQRPGKREVHLRDFTLFDFDGDKKLSPQEFAATPGLVPPHQRGAVPDPFDFLRDQAIAALDESYDNWDQRATLSIPTSNFANTFANSLGSTSTRTAVLATAQKCDVNSDGRISRDEAARFIDRQLGIITDDGDLIRLPNARMLDQGRFHWLDADKSGAISADEYAARYSANNPNARTVFERLDEDSNGELIWDEYAKPQVTQSHNDLVERFRRADANLDARLSAEELPAAVNASQQKIAPKFLPAFDDDGDGHWSFTEFLTSVYGGPITSWDRLREDKNRDLSLSFDEFLRNRERYLLLQRLYFFRFDTNGDGKLTQDEYEFSENPPNSIYRLAADGSVFELLWRDKTIPNGGSPEISPDEKWIAFDLYPDRKIMIVSPQGGKAREVCDGLMPSWSHDGKLFAYSHRGVQLGDLGGNKTEQFAPGWGAQWSPDGKLIAYEQNNGIWVFEVDKKSTREVLKAGDHQYGTLYYGMTWSPDSRRIALKAVQGNQNDVISIDTQGETADLQVHFSTTQSIFA